MGVSLNERVCSSTGANGVGVQAVADDSQGAALHVYTLTTQQTYRAVCVCTRA